MVDLPCKGPVIQSFDHWANTWSRHPVQTFSTLLAIWAGNSPVPGEFPTQRPVMWSFDVFFGLSLHKWLSKQSWGWWFEMPPRPLWRHCNDSQVTGDLRCSSDVTVMSEILSGVLPVDVPQNITLEWATLSYKSTVLTLVSSRCGYCHAYNYIIHAIFYPRHIWMASFTGPSIAACMNSD